ncbi:hypothetical protein XF24_00011 [candidate division SR1 bacterium Aalborg_AAW-1]|nr:hypothetical protein XF24_00011 [candidate division SR1 bacterium Aalborg_AAW-1]
MISLRTLINTTIFWFLTAIVFWGYTKWIDNTPAKELLYAIGWSDLGNLTISNNETIGITNEAQLLQKIDNMEKMIQATNMSCALLQLNTSNTANTITTQNTTVSSTQTITIPVFDAIMNTKLPASEQGTEKALRLIQRPVSSTNPTIPEIFGILTSLNLTNEEQQQGLINMFAGSPLSLGNHTLENGVLTLSILGSQSLSSAQFTIISSILEKTYTQFSGITSVIVQQA